MEKRRQSLAASLLVALAACAAIYAISGRAQQMGLSERVAKLKAEMAQSPATLANFTQRAAILLYLLRDQL